MDLLDFANKYIKEKVDYDKKFGAQCVDLFRQYCLEVLEVPHTGSVDSAKDLYLNYDKLPVEARYFRRIKGYSGIKPGDVAIWDKTDSNIHGHVAIVMYKEGLRICVIEQNGIKQDGVKIAYRSTNNMLGYLRFRA